MSVSPFWYQHQLDFMSYLQCINNLCVQHASRRTQRFCCLFFLCGKRKKHYKNNNRGKREHEKQCGLKSSKFEQSNINSTQNYCLYLCIHFQKKLVTFNWSIAKQTQSAQNHKLKQLFSERGDLLQCKNIFVWGKEKFQNKKKK